MYEIFERLLKERGITAYKVAQDTGITTATLSSWKKGRYTPKREKLQKLADYFNVSLEYLMTGQINEEAPHPVLTSRNERDIEKTLKGTLEQLDSQDGLMFDGEALDPETRELLKLSLENAIRTAKITAKKKFTPKSIQAKEDD